MLYDVLSLKKELSSLKTYKPDRMGMYFCAVCVCIISASLSLLSMRLLVRYQILMYTVAGLFVFSGLFVVMLTLPLCFSKASYRLSKDSVTKLSGFVFEKTQQIAFRNVQYVTLVMTPFCSFTSACFVIVHTPGGKMLLWFLSPDDASEISCRINRAIRRQEGAI